MKVKIISDLLLLRNLKKFTSLNLYVADNDNTKHIANTTSSYIVKHCPDTFTCSDEEGKVISKKHIKYAHSHTQNSVWNHKWGLIYIKFEFLRYLMSDISCTRKRSTFISVFD